MRTPADVVEAIERYAKSEKERADVAALARRREAEFGR